MSMTIPVVRIKSDNSDGFTEINKSDYDKGKHTLFAAKPKTSDVKSKPKSSVNSKEVSND